MLSDNISANFQIKFRVIINWIVTFELKFTLVVFPETYYHVWFVAIKGKTR